MTFHTLYVRWQKSLSLQRPGSPFHTSASSQFLLVHPPGTHMFSFLNSKESHIFLTTIIKANPAATLNSGGNICPSVSLSKAIAVREVDFPSSLYSCQLITVSALEMRLQPMRICLGTKENKHESKPYLLKAEKAN